MADVIKLNISGCPPCCFICSSCIPALKNKYTIGGAGFGCGYLNTTYDVTHTIGCYWLLYSDGVWPWVSLFYDGNRWVAVLAVNIAEGFYGDVVQQIITFRGSTDICKPTDPYAFYSMQLPSGSYIGDSCPGHPATESFLYLAGNICTGIPESVILCDKTSGVLTVAEATP